MDKYKPFERPERPIDPPEPPMIPEGESGWFQPQDEEFVPDELAFERALDDWDLMPKDRRDKFKECLLDLFYEDWDRIEAR
ncbi:MAG: hypothetical protein LUD72_05850 [Bacteroidales bacterium]|nr:hypothetical protein [Bacteroidales bacterium]